MSDAIIIEVTAGNLPEGWRGTPQELLDLFAENLTFTATGDFLTGQIGGVLPTTDVGIFISPLGELQVWSEDKAKYVPSYTVPVGGWIGYFGTGDAPLNFLYCDNADYAQADYPDLYAVIGDAHKRSGDASDHFRTPDFRGRFPLGDGPGEYGILGGDPVPTGVMVERSVGDYGGAEFGTLKQPTQAGAPTGRIVYQTRPPNSLPNDTSFYSGVTSPFVCCAFIIRYR
jgi:hypothetical protein